MNYECSTAKQGHHLSGVFDAIANGASKACHSELEHLKLKAGKQKVDNSASLLSGSPVIPDTTDNSDHGPTEAAVLEI